jgi:hypothetical protein
MSTTLRLPARRTVPQGTAILAVVGGLVAAAAIAVTLALGIGGGEVASSPLGAPATASPDLATQYRNDAVLAHRAGEAGGLSAAERYHHFR